MQAEQHDDATACFRHYAEAFQSLDTKAVARHFHEPALLIAPHGIFALLTREDVERTYEQVMTDLPARGYVGTEFSELAEQHLSDDLAVVFGIGAWKGRTGEELTRFGVRYTLKRSKDQWHIVVAAIYDLRSDETHLR